MCMVVCVCECLCVRVHHCLWILMCCTYLCVCMIVCVLCMYICTHVFGFIAVARTPFFSFRFLPAAEGEAERTLVLFLSLRFFFPLSMANSSGTRRCHGDGRPLPSDEGLFLIFFLFFCVVFTTNINNRMQHSYEDNWLYLQL